MSCLSERIAGAIIFLLSGYAFAGDLAIDSPEEMTVASIAPMPVRTLPPIPEPQRYAFEYQSDQDHPFYAPVENFYSTPITHDVRFGSATPAPMPRPASPQAPSQASNYLSLGPSTAPQLSLADVQNTTLTLGAQPQRRLSLTVNDWAFSATARVAVLHSHSTGATLSVRHGF